MLLRLKKIPASPHILRTYKRSITILMSCLLTFSHLLFRHAMSSSEVFPFILQNRLSKRCLLPLSILSCLSWVSIIIMPCHKERRKSFHYCRDPIFHFVRYWRSQNLHSH